MKQIASGYVKYCSFGEYSGKAVCIKTTVPKKWKNNVHLPTTPSTDFIEIQNCKLEEIHSFFPLSFLACLQEERGIEISASFNIIRS